MWFSAIVLALCSIVFSAPVFAAHSGIHHSTKKHSHHIRHLDSGALADISTTGYAPDSSGMHALDRQIMRLMHQWRMPGASLAVMKGGHLIVERGYGLADRQTEEKVTPNSLFRIASASKIFTATTILKLVEEGRLRLNDKVFQILDDLTPLPGYHVNPGVMQISVLNLLQMSSGWFNSSPGHLDPMFGPWPKRISDVLSPDLPASCEMTTRMMMSMPLRHTPGTSYAYSNVDYCILGLIVDKVAGAPYGYSGYQNYVNQHMLRPLGIEDMSIGSTQLANRLPDEVRYYGGVPNTVTESLSNTAYLPYGDQEVLQKNFGNGGWLATARDLATFVYALHSGRVLNARMLGLMRSKPSFVVDGKTTYYAIGGIMDYREGVSYWEQTGSFTGSNTLIITRPDDTTLAIVFNSRPDTAAFFSRFRPQLKKILIEATI